MKRKGINVSQNERDDWQSKITTCISRITIRDVSSPGSGEVGVSSQLRIRKWTNPEGQGSTCPLLGPKHTIRIIITRQSDDTFKSYFFTTLWRHGGSCCWWNTYSRGLYVHTRQQCHDIIKTHHWVKVFCSCIQLIEHRCTTSQSRS